jgi:hypothetical protein
VGCGENDENSRGGPTVSLGILVSEVMVHATYAGYLTGDRCVYDWPRRGSGGEAQGERFNADVVERHSRRRLWRRLAWKQSPVRSSGA